VCGVNQLVRDAQRYRIRGDADQVSALPSADAAIAVIALNEDQQFRVDGENCISRGFSGDGPILCCEAGGASIGRRVSSPARACCSARPGQVWLVAQVHADNCWVAVERKLAGAVTRGHCLPVGNPVCLWIRARVPQAIGFIGLSSLGTMVVKNHAQSDRTGIGDDRIQIRQRSLPYESLVHGTIYIV